MTFPRVVFLAAGVWGLAVLPPLYFLVDVTGRHYAAPVDYPHFFYGFLSVALAWQFAFLVIGSNPARFRPLMIPAHAREIRSRGGSGGAVRAGPALRWQTRRRRFPTRSWACCSSRRLR